MIKKFDCTPEVCVCCGDKPSTKGSIETFWCEQHAYRGKLLDWGAKNRYPELQNIPYAVAPGPLSWMLVSVFGNEDLVWLAISLTEYLDEQKREGRAG